MKESKEITLSTQAQELTINDLKKQITKIQEIMRSVMKENVHFGTIPGVPTKFLFKAGAEKLCMTFRLIPKFTIDKTVHDNGHLTYDITCELYHSSGAKVGEGLGMASTLEKKYRYRNEDIPTGVKIPQAWWNERNKDLLPKILLNNNVKPKSQTQLNKGNLELTFGKVGSEFQVVYRKKVENKDIADVYNTVIKMAKKRALVDATITALSVSDMFTQDPDAVISDFEEPEGDGDDLRTKKKPASKVRRQSSR